MREQIGTIMATVEHLADRALDSRRVPMVGFACVFILLALIIGAQVAHAASNERKVVRAVAHKFDLSYSSVEAFCLGRSCEWEFSYYIRNSSSGAYKGRCDVEGEARVKKSGRVRVFNYDQDCFRIG